jgi:very-short-patch-repair endonuclease
MDDPSLWKTPPRLWQKLKPRARIMRHEPTPAEALLWSRLRNSQVAGLRFRRQHTIGEAIADFYCSEAMLVVEVDGPIHRQRQGPDRVRQEWLESQRYQVLRFTNDRVLAETDAVVAEIGAVVRTRIGAKQR